MLNEVSFLAFTDIDPMPTRTVRSKSAASASQQAAQVVQPLPGGDDPSTQTFPAKVEGRRVGRPALPKDDQLHVVTVRLTNVQRDTFRRIGARAFRLWLDEQAGASPAEPEECAAVSDAR